jgi:glycosyltransferase involved in cell wall biosynthesis
MAAAEESRSEQVALPRVTVAIPTRERPEFARRALGSVLAQTGVVLEVVVVDDGSRGPAVDPAELDDPRVRMVTQRFPRGVAAARNAAIAHARGEWVAFLDDDDLWAPDKLERQLEVADECDADFVWTGQVLVDEHLKPVKEWTAPRAEGISRDLLDMNGIGGPSSMIVRRSLLEAVGGFDEELSVLADWDLWIRLAAAGKPAACDSLLTAYTIHSANMHIVAMDRAVEERGYLGRKHAALTREQGVELGGRRFWEWVARGYRLHGRRRAASATYLRLWRRSRSLRDLTRAAVVLAGEGAMGVGATRHPVVPPEYYEWLRR